MNNLSNMLKNGNIPDEMKEKLNGFLGQNANVAKEQTNSTQEQSTSDFSNDTSSSQNVFNNMNPEMLQNLMKIFSNTTNQTHNASDSSSSSDSFNFNNIDINTILKLKSVMEKMQSTKDDPRANLLLSLKPYLKNSRKSKVEQYVQLFNMTKVLEVFNENGGEKTK